MKRGESRELLRKLAPRLTKEPEPVLDKLAKRLGDLPQALPILAALSAVMVAGAFFERHFLGRISWYPTFRELSRLPLALALAASKRG